VLVELVAEIAAQIHGKALRDSALSDAGDRAMRVSDAA
jgi:hypothetical protein